MGRYLRLRYVSVAAFSGALLFTACDSSAPITPSGISASSGASVSGTVGQGVPVSVTVTGSDGSGYAGGVVSFTVTSGGGTVSPASATTDQSGRASATWTLGQTAGTQGLSATISGNTTTFTATAAAGSPADIQATSSFPGTFDPGSTLTQAAAFEVEDQYGNKVAGATVSFSASNGGSTDPTQGTTDTQGAVSTSWTLGPANGTQTLTATVGSVTPATVTAEAFDPCLSAGTLTLGGQASGTLSSESCAIAFGGTQLRFTDAYFFTAATSRGYTFTVASAFSDPAYWVYDNDYIGGIKNTGGNQVTWKGFLDATAPAVSGQAAAMAAKLYLGRVWSGAGGVGAYTLDWTPVNLGLDNCDQLTFTTEVLNTNQTLEATDCNLNDGSYVDLVLIHLEEGEGIRVNLTSTGFDTYLLIYNDALDAVLAEDNNSGTGTNSRLEYQAPSRGYYFIGPNSLDPATTGAYTLTIAPGTSASPQDRPGPRRSKVEGSDLLPPTLMDVSRQRVPISSLTKGIGRK